MICCATCNTEYVDFPSCTGQAYGCAAEVINKTIYGYYGSMYIDGEVWTFDIERPEHVKDGIICDNCIHQLKTFGRIRCISMDNWFGK